MASDQVNAFAVPSGQLFFYSGILPVCRTVGGVAAVMSHEIAHVVARHGAEQFVSASLNMCPIGVGVRACACVHVRACVRVCVWCVVCFCVLLFWRGNDRHSFLGCPLW